MKVRCKDAASGKQNIVQIDKQPSDVTFKEFLQLVAAETGHSLDDSLLLKRGVPPFAEIEPANLECSMEACGIRNGDSILVQKRAVSKAPEIAPQNFRRKIIDDDNSCLFNAIGYLLLDHDTSQSSFLRQIIAANVTAPENSETYSEVVLGMSPNNYASKMLLPNTWGGAIELAIFSKYFGCEIVAFDVETLTPMIFGEGLHYATRVFILYSGIHYDAVERTSGAGKSTTVFETTDDDAFQNALRVAQVENKARRYTNVNKFSLKCTVCKAGLLGQTEAQEHAVQTGHTSFAEA